MPNPRVGVPPRELVPRLYSKFKESEFTRAKVKRYYGKLAAISVTRALNDGWLNIKRKADNVNVYQLSTKALMHLGVIDTYVRNRACY